MRKLNSCSCLKILVPSLMQMGRDMVRTCCHFSSTSGVLPLAGTNQQSHQLSGQSFPADVDPLDASEPDSEERLSDVSDGGLSITDCSVNCAIESTLPEAGKPAEVKTGKNFKAGSRIPRSLPVKTGQATMAQSKLKDPSKSSTSTKKTTTSQATASLAKLPKRLQ